MKFFATFQHNNTEIDWNYHFFLAYHGCSICNATAAHAKKKVTTLMINIAIAIKISEQVVTTIKKLTNHVATLAIIAKGDFSSTTLTKIRKYFKFTHTRTKIGYMLFLIVFK
jgi:hypothetical protein